MALSLQTTYKGFDINEYIKITSFTTIEGEKKDGVKTYNVVVTVNKYTDSTKEYDIEQTMYHFSGLFEADLTLANFYVLLKAEIEGSIDA